jgi:hypothetical protein
LNCFFYYIFLLVSLDTKLQLMVQLMAWFIG